MQNIPGKTTISAPNVKLFYISLVKNSIKGLLNFIYDIIYCLFYSSNVELANSLPVNIFSRNIGIGYWPSERILSLNSW